MHLRLLLLLAFAVVIAACSPLQTLSTPDGSARIPINSPAAIAAYTAAAERELVTIRENTQALIQREQIKKDIEELKSFMASAALDRDRSLKSEIVPRSPRLDPTTTSAIDAKRERPPQSSAKVTPAPRAEDQVPLFRTPSIRTAKGASRHCCSGGHR